MATVPTGVRSGSSSRALIRSPLSFPICKQRKRRKPAVSTLQKPMPRDQPGVPTQTPQGVTQKCPHDSSYSFYFNPLTLESGVVTERGPDLAGGRPGPNCSPATGQWWERGPVLEPLSRWNPAVMTPCRHTCESPQSERESPVKWVTPSLRASRGGTQGCGPDSGPL